MYKKTLLFMIAAFQAILLAGCTEQSSEAQFSIHPLTGEPYTYGRSLYAEGLLTERGGKAYFLDYATMESVPLCNKPNCTHSGMDCTASLCMNDATATQPIVYQDYVYYFTSIDQIVDAEDGKSQTYEIKSNCMRVSLKTGEAETFAEIPDYDPTRSIYSVFAENQYYFIAYSEDSAYQNNDGTWHYGGMDGSQYLCCINLDTGTFENLGLVNDSPYAENNTILSETDSYTIYPQVLISGVYNGKLYMYYQYVTDQQTLLDAMEEVDGNLLLLEDDTYVPWIYENKVYNLETGTWETSDLPVASFIGNDWYLYWDETQQAYVALRSDGTETIIEGFTETDSPRIVNGKLWDFLDSMKCFDLETQTLTQISDSLYQDGTAEVLAYINGMYVVEYYDDSGSAVYEKMTESKLLS